MNYYWIEIIIWNHIIVYRLLVFDKNTWNHCSLSQKKSWYKLFKWLAMFDGVFFINRKEN